MSPPGDPCSDLVFAVFLRAEADTRPPTADDGLLLRLFGGHYESPLKSEP